MIHVRCILNPVFYIPHPIYRILYTSAAHRILCAMLGDRIHDNSPQRPGSHGAGFMHCCTKTRQTKKNPWFFAASFTTTDLEFWRERPAAASALPWRTKPATASSTSNRKSSTCATANGISRWHLAGVRRHQWRKRGRGTDASATRNQPRPLIRHRGQPPCPPSQAV